MKQRDALRLAANELMEMAQCRAAEYGMGEVAIPDGCTARDMERIMKGFRTLAARLEYTVTGERPARPTPEDPDQYPLFEES